MLTKATLEHIGEFVFEIDTTGKIISFSGNDSSLIGAANVGNSYFRCFNSQPELSDAVKTALSGNKSNFIPSSDTDLPLIYCYPIEDGGEVIGMVGIALDASNIHHHVENFSTKLSYLQNYNKDLERFAYVASHDLHEPLRSVRSFIGLLEEEYDDVLSDDAKSYIEFAMNGTKRMQQLIDDLLLYNRIGQPNLPIKLMDVGKILELQIYKLNDLIESKNAAIDIGEHPGKVVGNSKQLAMVFYNLLHNALIFNKSEKPHIAISGKEIEDFYQFSIKDNGTGIASRIQDEVFEMFFKLNNPIQDSTGIGLAVCKKVVQRHGGKIWFESEKEEGTTFHFTIAKKLLQF